MGLLDTVRHHAAVRLMRTEPVVVVATGVDRERVDACVRQWCPHAVRRGDAVLTTRDGFELRGPIHRSERLWPDPLLSAHYQAAYVTRCSGDDRDEHADDTSRYSLLDGLARRLGGRVRQRAGEPWSDPTGEPAGPVVFAPRRLSPDEAIGLLSAAYPGLELGYRNEDSYELQTDGLVLVTELRYPDTFPLVRRQPWFTTPDNMTQYDFVYDTSPQGLAHMARAAQILADAAGGIVLDEDGFPWS